MRGTVRGIIFASLFVILFLGAERLMIPKNHSLLTMDDFYELDRDSQEILFIGASHNVHGMKPQVVEDITGYSATSVAIIGQMAPLHIDFMEEALRYQSPRLVVVDIYRFRAREHKMPLPDLHESVNGLRWSGGGRKAKEHLGEYRARERAGIPIPHDSLPHALG